MSLTEPVPQREPLTVLFSARTDTGQVRSTNEDNFLVDRRLRLYVVCDGLGGHQGGEIASATAVNVVREGVLKRRDAIERYDRERADESELLEMLGSVGRVANQRIHERGRQSAAQRGMGTTLSLLLLAGDRGFIAHVGDTRIYRLRDGLLQQLTEDHSLVTEMRRGLYMTREQIDALDARLKNQITRAVGVHDTVEVDVFSIDVLPGDRYLLCSDGLHGLVSDADLTTLIAHPELVEAASRLVDRANANGGKDNITAIVVELSAPRTPEAHRQIWPIFEVVRSTSLFQGLADLELASIIERINVVSLAAGEALVRDASTLPGLFMVLEGELQVVRQAEVVAMLRRGDFFGEDALFLERTSGATVLGSAAGASIGVVERRHFDELQRTSPNVALKLALAIGRSLARKVEASAREGGSMRLLYKDPGAMTRPVPRPATSQRVMADTEPEPMARMTHESSALPTATGLRRPRGADRRAGAAAVTHPAIPVIRGPTSAELGPVAPSAPFPPAPPPLPDARQIDPRQFAITQTRNDVGPRSVAGRADTLPMGPSAAAASGSEPGPMVSSSAPLRSGQATPTPATLFRTPPAVPDMALQVADTGPSERPVIEPERSDEADENAASEEKL